MDGTRLEFVNPITHTISRTRFAPKSNNLLISCWDSCLRLYAVETSSLRLEALSEAALLNCCFQEESVAFSAGSDGAIRRYDLHSGSQEITGNHSDIATCIEYSDVSSQVISSGLDKMILFWDIRQGKTVAFSKSLDAEVESMSLSGFELLVTIDKAAYSYDLRKLDGPLQVKDSKIDARIRCINSALSFRGFAVGSVDGRVAVEVYGSSTSQITSYAFRCHPRRKKGNNYFASVNDIAFNPFIPGTFITGDNEGYVIAWDCLSRRRLYELPQLPNSVASMSYNHSGDLLAITASHTYEKASELVGTPQIFIYNMDEDRTGSASAGSTTEKSASTR